MDHLNLDNRETYLREQEVLLRMSTQKLNEVVTGLYKMRYEDQDEKVEAYYRLAVAVQLRRSKKNISDRCWFVLFSLVCLLYKVINI